MTLNKSKVVKLMQLTLSDNDHEALAALRKAQELLKAAEKNWEEILFPPKEPAYSQSSYTQEPEEDWDHIFDVLCVRVTGTARDFIESLATQWDRKGYLSKKQQSAALKFYRNYQ